MLRQQSDAPLPERTHIHSFGVAAALWYRSIKIPNTQHPSPARYMLKRSDTPPVASVGASLDPGSSVGNSSSLEASS